MKLERSLAGSLNQNDPCAVRMSALLVLGENKVSESRVILQPTLLTGSR